jgi:hypothetical protein
LNGQTLPHCNSSAPRRTRSALVATHMSALGAIKDRHPYPVTLKVY